MNENFLLLPILIPAIGGLLSLLFSRLRKVSAAVAVLATGLSFIFTVILFLNAGLSLRLPAEGNWFSFGNLPLFLELRNTVFPNFVNLFVSLFGFLLAIYSISYFARKDWSGRYYAFLQWAVMGSSAAVLSSNLIFFLISWEVVTVMFFMMANFGRSEEARLGAAKSFCILGLSDCAILLAIVLLAITGAQESLSMDKIHVVVATRMSLVIYLLFLVGALAKAGSMPFHTWIPKVAEGAPTPVMAFLPAALDKLLGIYFLAFISLKMFALGGSLRILLMAVGAVTILGAVMMAMIQHELKKLLSFHAVSQVGYMVLGIGTGIPIGIVGGLFHMLNNAIYKCALFLGGGSAEHQAGTTDLDELGGLARRMPLTFVGFLIAAFAISGIPPLNGFASKWMIYQGVLEATRSEFSFAWLFLVAAVFGSALTLASFVKVTYSVFWGTASDRVKSRSFGEAPATMTAPLLILAALCIIFGVFVSLPVGKFLAPSFEALTGSKFAAGTSGLWSPTLSTILILLGIVIGIAFYLFSKAFRGRVVRPFIGGETLPGESGRFVGTDFYRTVSEMPGLNVAYRDAEQGAFDIYHWGAKYGPRIVGVLRRLHSGNLPRYVAWIIAGLLIVVVMMLNR